MYLLKMFWGGGGRISQRAYSPHRVFFNILDNIAQYDQPAPLDGVGVHSVWWRDLPHPWPCRTERKESRLPTAHTTCASTSAALGFIIRVTAARRRSAFLSSIVHFFE